MTAFIDVKYVPGRFRKAYSKTGVLSVAGVDCLEFSLELPEKARARRIARYFDRWAKELKTMGIVDVILKNGSQCKKELLARGFKEHDNGFMMLSKSGEIAYSASCKHDSVFLSAENADRMSVEIFNKLCDRFRYIVLEAPDYAERVFMEAGSKYGVSPSMLKKDRVVKADCAIFLSNPKGPTFLSAGCVYFAPFGCGDLVFGGTPINKINLSFPERYRKEIPEGYNAVDVLTWLYNIGRIAPEEIIVESATP